MIAEKKAMAEIKEVKHQITESKSQIDRLKAEKVRQYEAYADGLITKDEYLRKKNQFSQQIEELEAGDKLAAETFEKNKALLEHSEEMLDVTEEFEAADKLTKPMVDKLISNVYVHDLKHLEIEFAFEDKIHEIQETFGCEA